MMLKAKDTVLSRQAEPTPAIKKRMIMFTVKEYSILQRHTYIIVHILYILITRSTRRTSYVSPNDVPGPLTVSTTQQKVIQSSQCQDPGNSVDFQEQWDDCTKIVSLTI
jgi:hypothetical protein